MTYPIKVAVTGLHRGDNPQPGASVIRSLRRFYPDLGIVGLSYDPLESGLYSHDIDRIDATYLLPFPLKGPEVLLDRIRYVHRQEKFQVIIPCLDSELSNFIAIYPELQKMGVAALLPSRAAHDMRAKENLASFCADNAIRCPTTCVANDIGTLADYAARIGYPVYVKGKYYEAFLVTSPAELVERFESIVRIWGTPVLAQEALFGDEYDFVGLAGADSDIVGFCAVRKLLRTSSGKGFGGVVINDVRLEAVAHRIIKRLRWRGPFEIEFLKMPGREHFLFEINPRFPAWVDFPAQIGCNLPARLLDMLLGRDPAELAHCDAGQMFIRHSVDLVADMAELAKLSSDGEYLAGPLASKSEVVS